MTGVIDVGGGLRGIYGAGVFDRCIDDGVKFDYCIGVSAGAANIASYTAGQRGRNYRFFNVYSFHKEYMGLDCLKKTGNFLNLSYVYSTLANSDGADPLDFEAFCRFPGEVKTVATNALTGQPKYFDRSDYSLDDYSILMASCCLPIACKPVVIDDVPYFDGGISDPVPIEKAFADGCDRVVLILTKPLGAQLDDRRNEAAAKLLKHRYTRTSEALAHMSEKYHSSLALALEYAECGKALIIAPSDCCGMKTLTRDRIKLDSLYHMGYDDAAAIKEFIREK